MVSCWKKGCARRELVRGMHTRTKQSKSPNPQSPCDILIYCLMNLQFHGYHQEMTVLAVGENSRISLRNSDMDVYQASRGVCLDSILSGMPSKIYATRMLTRDLERFIFHNPHAHPREGEANHGRHSTGQENDAANTVYSSESPNGGRTTQRCM